MNIHSKHVWSDENLHAIRSHREQWQFSINLAGILGDSFAGPHILQVRVGGRGYLNFLGMHLIWLLEDVSNTRLRMRFQYVSASSYYGREVRQWLSEKYPWLRIGRGRDAPVYWPTLSPELNPLDSFFLLLGYLNTKVSAGTVHTREKLWRRIQQLARELKNIHGLFELLLVSF
jgi:hypothetical protein